MKLHLLALLKILGIWIAYQAEAVAVLLQLNLRAAPKALELTNAAFFEGMTQEYVKNIFYGDSRTNPKAFDGLAPRFASLSAGYSDRVIDHGGTTALTSMWFVTWGEPFCHGIYPDGTNAGITSQDLGIETKTDPVTGGNMRVSRQKYNWRGGLSVRDPRAIVRIANIDTTASLTAGQASGDTSTDIWRSMVRAYHKLLNPAMRLPLGQTRIYCNATVMEALDHMARKTVNAGVGLTYENIDGRLVLQFRGIPIKRVDQIVNTETRVV